MKIGIIGYGSMGKMILEKMAGTPELAKEKYLVANRTPAKIEHLKNTFQVCENNAQLAAEADIIFLCVGPSEMKKVLTDIQTVVKKEVFLVSLNGSIQFAQMEQVCGNKFAKVIPGVTAEVNQSQTLVCFNELVESGDKELLIKLLGCMGDVIELPESEIGMGSELVSCMPGFIASIFHEICVVAEKHTSIPQEQIIQMVLKTMAGTGQLMLSKEYTFEEVIHRVATKGGITEEGVKVIHNRLPEVVEELFEKTLEKRSQTTRKASKMFGE